MMIKYYKKNKIEIISILLVYGMSFFTIPLNQGVFWDDFVTSGYRHNYQTMLEIYRELASVFNWLAHLHAFIFSFGDLAGIIIIRVSVFLFHLFSALLLFAVLKKIKELTDIARLFIILLFITFPTNFSRIILANIPYQICFFFFFLGLYFIFLYKEKQKIIFRILSLLSFLLSFLTNSLLMFYGVAIFAIIYFEKFDINSIKKVYTIIIKYLDYFIIPILFYFLKSIFYKSSGIYSGYNEITISGFLKGFIEIIKILPFLYKTISESLNEFNLLLLFLSFLFTIWYKNKLTNSIFEKLKTNFIFIIISIIFIFLAIFPYLVVGKFPSVFTVDDRHAILIPLGLSIFIFYGINLILQLFKLKSKKILIIILVTIVICFVKINSKIYSEFIRHHYLQLSLINHFKVNPIFKNHTTFLFNDISNDGAKYFLSQSVYIKTGLFKIAFNEETRYATHYKDFPYDFNSYIKVIFPNKIYRKRYNITNYVPSEPEFLFTISKGTYQLNTTAQILKALFLQYFYPSKFEKNLLNILNIKTDKLFKNYIHLNKTVSLVNNGNILLCGFMDQFYYDTNGNSYRKPEKKENYIYFKLDKPAETPETLYVKIFGDFSNVVDLKIQFNNHCSEVISKTNDYFQIKIKSHFITANQANFLKINYEKGDPKFKNFIVGY